MKPPTSGPHEYRPHGPKFGQAYLDIEPKSATVFYQPPNAEQVELAGKLPDLVEVEPDLDLRIDDYQAWCELNWKKPHGSRESADRLNEKLLEEAAELLKEFEIDVDQRSAEDIAGELGDVIWCTSGIASNLGISVKHGLMMLFDKYARGTRYFHDKSVPAWVAAAQSHSYDEHMKVSAIEQVIEQGYEPQIPTHILIDEDPDPMFIQIQDALSHIDMNVRFLASILAMNYETDNYQSGITSQAEIAEHVVAQIYLDSAFLAKNAAGATLNSIINTNILKLSNRVETNRVDKSDGSRQ